MNHGHAKMQANQSLPPCPSIGVLAGLADALAGLCNHNMEVGRMTLPKDGKLLRVFIGESDRYEGLPLYEWIVRKGRENGLAGATVLRGIEGYGAHSQLHTAKILRLSSDLPVVVEIVDTEEKIESFLPLIDDAVGEGIATVEKVEVRFYRAGNPES